MRKIFIILKLLLTLSITIFSFAVYADDNEEGIFKRWFESKHIQLKNRIKIQNMAQCDRCHQDAHQGLYEKEKIHISKQEFDVKELKETGKISSLEIILDKLSEYNIKRLLEVELKQDNNQYVYELEYINDKGILLEIEVDAVTAQIKKRA